MKHIALATVILLLPLLGIAQLRPAAPFILKVRVEPNVTIPKMYLAWQHEGRKILDSATQRDGLFTFSGKVNRPLNASLVADDENLGAPELIKRLGKGIDVSILKLYIHPGTINLRTDSLLQRITFTGSIINRDNEQMKALLKPITDQIIRCERMLKFGEIPISDTSTRRRIFAQMDSLAAQRRPIIKQFIQRNPGSYISLIQLEHYAGSSPDLAIIKPMFNRLSASVRNTIEGKEFSKFLYDRENMTPGIMAPDFVQNNVDGKAVPLSSFKGKFVLLDFWASWCGPCRQVHPELVQIYNDFKDKNFTILGISLDGMDEKDSWIKAIKDDQLSWTQVSDLKRWENKVAKLYSVKAIPQNFLIDPNGVIIAKDIQPKELRKKLEELLIK